MKRHLAIYVITIGLLGMLVGCGMPTFSRYPIYNSNDHSSLPCESHLYEVFFPVEFDKNGKYLFKKQQVDRLLEEVKKRSGQRVSLGVGRYNRQYWGYEKLEKDELEKRERKITELEENELTDLFVVVHGWNKTPSAAEVDYQDFICRILAKPKATTKTHSLVVGVFWPSTLLPNFPVSFPLGSYYPVRARADTLASEGVKQLLVDLGSTLIGFYGDAPTTTRMHVIGHSFGGRIAIKTLRALLDFEPLKVDCQNLDFQYNQGLRERFELSMLLRQASLNIILLNSAASHETLTGLHKAVEESSGDIDRLEERRWELNRQPLKKQLPLTMEEQSELQCLTEIFRNRGDLRGNFSTNKKHVRIYNIYSEKDWTIAKLYWIVEGLDKGLGASPYGDHPVPVDDFGEIKNWRNEESTNNIWDVDASAIIHDHSDIYKGRVASLIREIIEHARSESLK